MYIKNKIIIIHILILPIMLSAARCSNSELTKSKQVRILEYNVKSLFDAKDDGTEFPEFSIARGKWNVEKYRTRLANTAQVVLAASEENSNIPGPDIVCLVEIENKNVAIDLVNNYLPKSAYKWFAAAPKENSVFTNIILSRFPIVAEKSHRLISDEKELTRLMIEADIEIYSEKIVLFLCHWKSKIGGVEKTESLRLEAAALLKNRILARMTENPEYQILVCGDFNENPDEYMRIHKAYPTAFRLIKDAKELKYNIEDKSILMTYDEKILVENNTSMLIFFNPWSKSSSYSYYYKNVAERIDNFLLDSSFINSRHLLFKDFNVLEAAFLFNSDQKPKEWRVNSGCSDHLPLILILELKK